MFHLAVVDLAMADAEDVLLLLWLLRAWSETQIDVTLLDAHCIDEPYHVCE